MDDMAVALITAVGLVLVLEGLVYSLFPDGMKKMMAQMAFVPPGMLRRAGLVAVAAGVLIVWLARG